MSPPAVLGDLVAVADLDGYVHFLDSATGDLAARTRALSERVSAVPLVIGDTLYMLDVAGNVVALRASRVDAGTGTVSGSAGSDDAMNIHPR
jgi:outer membrane protein assembly factor BamB